MDQPNNNDNGKKAGVCPLCGGVRSSWDCSCGYGHMHFHRYFWLRLVIALIVGLLIFCMGVKVGEIRQLMSSRGGYYHNFEYNMTGYPVYGGGMMGGGYGVAVPSGVQVRSASSTVQVIPAQ